MTTDFRQRMSYGDYLGLDLLLSAQKPLSDAPTSRSSHHHPSGPGTLAQALRPRDRRRHRRDPQGTSCRPPSSRWRASRASSRSSWRPGTCSRPITPADYLAFRPSLGESSGFQSWQYRALEFRLGAKDPRMLAVHKHHPAAMRCVEKAYREPSLYDEAILLLARRGLPCRRPAPRATGASRMVSTPGCAMSGSGFIATTRGHFDLYELAEELVDIEDQFQQCALPPHEDGRAHHRLQDRHRRVLRRAVPEDGPRTPLLPPNCGICAGSSERAEAVPNVAPTCPASHCPASLELLRTAP